MHRRINKFTDIWEAQRLLLSHISPIDSKENVRVFDSVGRVVYTPVVSPKDLPPFHASHMDGYAVRFVDLKQASKTNPVKLPVVEFCVPGKRSSKILGVGEAARVLTGAFLPEGADAVVPQEEVMAEDGYVVFTAPVEPWQFVDLKGFDVKADQSLFDRGHLLKYADTVLLAAIGIKSVEVVRRPKVGIVAVGDELTDSFEEAGRGKILNTHTHLIKGIVEAAGGEARFLGIIPDNAQTLLATLKDWAEKIDLFLSIAGSSVSEKDVSSILASQGSGQIFVHGLTLQPGRVGGFTFVEGKPLIMLPGLIMSTLNVFMFLAYPAIRKMLHMPPSFYSRRIKARLTNDIQFRKYIDFVKIVWVHVEDTGDELVCRPIPGESSGVSIPSRSDGFVTAPPGVNKLEKGSLVWVHLPPAL